jgi:hypothetical protein
MSPRNWCAMQVMGRDGLRSVPFFPCYASNDLSDGTEAVPPMKDPHRRKSPRFSNRESFGLLKQKRAISVIPWRFIFMFPNHYPGKS